MPPTVSIQLDTTRIATGLQNPVYAVAPPGDRDRLFILEQNTGNIKILDLRTRTITSTPFLTIPANELQATGEQGLLGLAFHPNYANNGKFYVTYSSPGGGSAGQNKLVEYQVSNDPNLADPNSAKVILTRDQPVSNHNGGWVGFSPDGYLYWSTGDGGAGVSDNAQDITDNLLGKILRLDVNGDDFPSDPNRNYAIPPTNPFVNQSGDDEIWAYGLRNPWRSSFDRQTGAFYIADVGEGKWEEVNIQPAGSTGGQNYGWNVREGTEPFKPQPVPPNLVDPSYQYEHPNGEGRSITGGYVYRGPVAALNGTYFFADFIARQLWSLRYTGSGVTDVTNQTAALTPSNGVGEVSWISSFAEDGAGNLYLTDLFGGELFRLEVKQYIVGTDSNDTLLGGPSSDTLLGGLGNDNLDGGADADYLQGEVGDDTLNGGTGNDTLIGGSGDDLYVVDSTNDTITENLGEGMDTVIALANFILSDNVENLYLYNAAISGAGNSSDNFIVASTSSTALSLSGLGGNDFLFGGTGDDTINGGVGNDLLFGDAGNDQLIGGTGDDIYVVDSTSDTVTENLGEGTDTVIATANFTLSNNGENLYLYNGAIIGTGNGTVNVIAGNKLVASLLNGGGGSDFLYGGIGNDTLIGDEGNDIITGDVGGDQFVFGGSGITLSRIGVDTIVDFSSGDKIVLSQETFALSGTPGSPLSGGDFATVATDLEAQNSTALIVYNSNTGSLFYNQDRNIGSGFGTGGQFATLLRTPALTPTSFQIAS